jgi:pimeloyl-ACP methyl ester carboxylesterase
MKHVLLSVLAFALLIPSSARAQPLVAMRCQDLTFDVKLSPDHDTVYQVAGFLCSRGSVRNKTLQVTLHGATYSHLYWNWPRQPALYSYIRRATAAGYAVLNVDRIGIGASDHPPAAEVTIESNAYVVHQIVQEMRSGQRVVPGFGRVRARRIALVGHSLGSLISIQEAATYDDVDGVVLTGVSHNVTPALGDVSFYPANLDPRFAGRNIPDGYLTTVPDTRVIFYHPPFVDPLILAVDEQTKETVTTGELDTAVPSLGLSTGVHVPVLVVVGDKDGAFCNPPSCSESGSLATEPGFYPEDACAEARSVPESGHDLNLHVQAPRAYHIMLTWLNRRVGHDDRVPAPSPCQP